jgi:hypothetical protein
MKATGRSRALDAYEIRIVKKLAKSPMIYACSLVSDHAAIRRAQSLTEDGDLVEVWRGLDCVYSSGIESRGTARSA